MKSCVSALQQTGHTLPGSLELIISCEHGGNRIPGEYAHLFKTAADQLDTHKSFDCGALELAKNMAAAFKAPLYCSTTSRLLVDLNRSPDHRRLFSCFTEKLGLSDKSDILDKYYYPHRRSLELHITGAIRRERNILHIGVHTFTPEFQGVRRRADAGLLYDPSRAGERDLCIRWKKALSSLNPGMVIRRNYPYLGRADGLIPFFRTLFSPGKYVGIELEVNQKHPLGNNPFWREMQGNIISSLAAVIPVSDLPCCPI